MRFLKYRVLTDGSKPTFLLLENLQPHLTYKDRVYIAMQKDHWCSDLWSDDLLMPNLPVHCMLRP